MARWPQIRAATHPTQGTKLQTNEAIASPDILEDGRAARGIGGVTTAWAAGLPDILRPAALPAEAGALPLA